MRTTFHVAVDGIMSRTG